MLRDRFRITTIKIGEIKMNILAIHSGHNSGIALIMNNKLEFAISEEKFTNTKNQSGFPKLSVRYVLEKYLQNQLLDKIVIASEVLLPSSHYEYLELKEDKQINIKDSIKNIVKKTGVQSLLKNSRIKQFHEEGLKEIKEELRKIELGNIDIEFVEHHLAHALSIFPVIGDNSKNKKLIFTMDGSGDGLSSTVSIFNKGKIERIAHTEESETIGGVYSQTTRFLGMKILEHEYKVMGLAAYAKEKYFMDTYNKVFKDIVWLSKSKPLTFESKFPLDQFENHLKEVAVGERFDNVSGALQYFLEDIVIKWIKEAINHTGVTEVITSGGVFMNVKLNKLIQELSEVTKVDFMPSSGDDTLPFGAAYKIWKDKNTDKNIIPTKQMYLGMEYSNDNIEKYIKNNKVKEKYKVEYFDDVEKKIAELLAEFNIVARCKGQTEFGARSLGNRAILGNPKDMTTFYEVNDMIKVRDFWMPFAPSVLDSYADKYLKDYNTEKNIPYFMISAYDSTDEFQKNCRAAMHQGDKTARPQVVTKDTNKDYHKLLSYFEELTGIGAVMNTSYNLHGYPLAGTPEQAIFTFENSGLKYLALKNWIISKK